jgi:DNA polymerase III epsilon subunit-like protein
MALSFFWRQALKRSTLLDIETTGLDPTRHAPLGAASGRFGAPIQETWFTYETAERVPQGPWYRKFGIKTEEQIRDLMEPFAREEWKRSWAGARRQWIAGGGVPQPARKYFSKILAREARAGRFLWTHNVRFDITQFGSQFAHPAAQRKMYEQAAVPGWTKFDPYSGRVFPTTSKAAYRMRSILYDKPQLGPTAMREWYGAYRSMVKQAVKAGKPAVLDSLAVAQSMLGMAQAKGAMARTGDIFTGTSIEALAAAFGVTAKGRAHLAKTDVETLQQILPKLLETTEALYKGKRLKPWQAGALRYLGEVQPEIAKRNVERMFAQAVSELRETGKYRLRKGGYSTNPEDLVGVYKKFYKHRSYYHEGMLEEAMTRVTGLSDEGIKHILLERARIPRTLGQGSKLNVLGSRIGAQMRRFLAGRNPYLVAGAAALAAFGVGALVLPDREEHNTVVSLREDGFAGFNRRLATDFGSGYQGPNPWLSPEYNKAQEVPAYQLVRASSLGLSEDMMYRHLTRKQRKNELLEAFGMAGQAFHLLEEAKARQGYARTEKFVHDEVNNITGHIDIMMDGIPKDVKTLSRRRFLAMQAGGPDPKHVSQINFYAKMVEAKAGVLEYVMREDPNKRVTYEVPYSEELYREDVEKVNRVRERIERDLNSGKLQKEKLRYTASLETLEEAAAEEPEDYSVPFLARSLTEEMDYLSDVLVRRWRPEESFEIQDGLQHGGLAMYLRRMITDFGSEYQAVMAISKWAVRFSESATARYVTQAEVKDMLVYLRSQIKNSQLLRVGRSSFGLEMTDAALKENIAAIRKLEAAKGYKGGVMLLKQEHFMAIPDRRMRIEEIKRSVMHESFHSAAANVSGMREKIVEGRVPQYLIDILEVEGYGSVDTALEIAEGAATRRAVLQEEAAAYMSYADPGTAEGIKAGVAHALHEPGMVEYVDELKKMHQAYITRTPVVQARASANKRAIRRSAMTKDTMKRHAPRITGVRVDDSPGVEGMVQKMHNKRKGSHNMYHR